MSKEDQQLVELRAQGIVWAEVAARLGRDKQNCKQRYGLLGKKAQAAGSKSVSVPGALTASC